MNDKEITMQITLKAMELGYVKTLRPSSDDTLDTVNSTNAQQICEFYKAIFETVKNVCRNND